ncbi:MAG: sugar ABC transporter permease [Chloroflexi bacterium]|nr:sugar ABC transporter permease [Chloroflexota bacterium]
MESSVTSPRLERAPAPKRRISRLALKDALSGYLFITPQLLGFLIFVLGPVAAIFFFSLQSRNLLSGKATFIGLQNYVQLFTHDPIFIKVLVNSLIFTAGLVPLNLVLALVLAIMLARQTFVTGFFRTVFFSPVVTSAVAWAIVWSFMLQGDQGTINQVLKLFGIQGPNWLRDPGWAMFWVIVVRVLKNVGMNMVLFLAALQDLPREHVEAAQVDGANIFQSVRYIILPFLAPTILLVMIITVIGSLDVFDHIMLMTGGGPSNATMVMAYYVYFTAFQLYETGYASAVAVILFLIALGLTILQWSLRKRFIDYEI